MRHGHEKGDGNSSLSYDCMSGVGLENGQDGASRVGFAATTADVGLAPDSLESISVQSLASLLVTRYMHSAQRHSAPAKHWIRKDCPAGPGRRGARRVGERRTLGLHPVQRPAASLGGSGSGLVERRSAASCPLPRAYLFWPVTAPERTTTPEPAPSPLPLHKPRSAPTPLSSTPLCSTAVTHLVVPWI